MIGDFRRWDECFAWSCAIAHSTVAFTLVPEGGNTRVTWAIFGPTSLMTKAMGLFMSMDRMMGPGFEAGLRRLKGVAEA